MMHVYLETDHTLADALKLWRYMDLTKLISLLDKKAIWLARADTFADKQEGFFPDEMQARLTLSTTLSLTSKHFYSRRTRRGG